MTGKLGFKGDWEVFAFYFELTVTVLLSPHFLHIKLKMFLKYIFDFFVFSISVKVSL